MSLIEKVRRIFLIERRYFFIGLIAIAGLLLITFYQSISVALMFSLFIILAFYIPGYLLGLMLSNEGRLLRTSLGVGGAIAFFGIGSYLLGLIGVHVKYHAVITTIALYVLLLVVILVMLFERGKKNNLEIGDGIGTVGQV